MKIETDSLPDSRVTRPERRAGCGPTDCTSYLHHPTALSRHPVISCHCWPPTINSLSASAPGAQQSFLNAKEQTAERSPSAQCRRSLPKIRETRSEEVAYGGTDFLLPGIFKQRLDGHFREVIERLAGQGLIGSVRGSGFTGWLHHLLDDHDLSRPQLPHL